MTARADHSPFLRFRDELAYGLRDGVLVSIDAVHRGAKCACVCSACGNPLIARKGDILIHHFAHAGSGAGCGVGLETNAHLWAKQTLEATLWITLPPVGAEASGLRRRIHAGGRFDFKAAELEKHAGEIVPDVQLTTTDGRRLIVEVMVTHACDAVKIERIRAGGVSAIEVDLSHLRDCQDADLIARALLTDAPRTWLFNPAIDRAEAELLQEAAEGGRQRPVPEVVRKMAREA